MIIFSQNGGPIFKRFGSDQKFRSIPNKTAFQNLQSFSSFLANFTENKFMENAKNGEKQKFWNVIKSSKISNMKQLVWNEILVVISKLGTIKNQKLYQFRTTNSSIQSSCSILLRQSYRQTEIPDITDILEIYFGYLRSKISKFELSWSKSTFFWISIGYRLQSIAEIP